MELFLPSLFIFLLSALVVVFIVPRLSPLIIASLSIALLAFGIYHHFHIFWNEYRTATWSDQLKLFAPGIMLALILAYVLFAIVLFFTGGSVPVPSMPNVQLPAANTATNVVTSTLNNALNMVLPNSVAVVAPPNTNKNTEPTPTLGLPTLTAPSAETKNNRGQNLTKSFLAAI